MGSFALSFWGAVVVTVVIDDFGGEVALRKCSLEAKNQTSFTLMQELKNVFNIYEVCTKHSKMVNSTLETNQQLLILQIKGLTDRVTQVSLCKSHI